MNDLTTRMRQAKAVGIPLEQQNVVPIASDMCQFSLPVSSAITFNVGGREVMTLRRDRIEIAEGLEVSETAQAVFDALETMITNAWGRPKKTIEG